MSISRIELQGTITRAQDYTAIKHNEDNKGIVDQSNFQTQFHKGWKIRLLRYIRGMTQKKEIQSMMQRKREKDSILAMEENTEKKTRIVMI